MKGIGVSPGISIGKAFVIKKAEAVEKLAHKVEDEMKASLAN